MVDATEIGFAYSNIVDIDWVKVPDSLIPQSSTKRWGAISGGYIKAPIWRDLNELQKMQSPGTWKWLLREWKIMKTGRSPSVHFNNIIGNVILSEMYDFRTSDLIRAVKEIRSKGAFYKEAIEQGIFSTGYVRSELNRLDVNQNIDKVLEEVEAAEGIEHSNLQKTWNLFKKITPLPGSPLDRKLQSAYQFEDEVSG